MVQATFKNQGAGFKQSRAGLGAWRTLEPCLLPLYVCVRRICAMTNYPTARQRKILWVAITTASIAAIGAIAAWLLILLSRLVGFLQPVLIPIAIAAVLAFLLDPVVRMLCARTRLPRTGAVVLVFAMAALLLALLFVSIVPQLYQQTALLVREMPSYTVKAQKRLNAVVDGAQKKLDQLDHMLPVMARPAPAPTPAIPSLFAEESPSPSPSPAPAPAPPDAATPIRDYIQQQLPDIGAKIPLVLDSAWHLVLRSIGSFGLLLNAVIIPIYLFFLLVESRNIARAWSEYLPLQDSPLKQEIVSVMLEINGYLVAFFRGQLIVSTIDGLLIGLSLYFFAHLDFSLFVGLLVMVLTFIPYLGIVLCYVPATLIALIQYGDWQHPLLVVGIMFIVQTLDGFLIAPKIVGDSVGLHPLTVIISIFGWSLLFEGPIGALVAVPLTASLKVLLRRYVWEREHQRRFGTLPPAGPEALPPTPPPPVTLRGRRS